MSKILNDDTNIIISGSYKGLTLTIPYLLSRSKFEMLCKGKTSRRTLEELYRSLMKFSKYGQITPKVIIKAGGKCDQKYGENSENDFAGVMVFTLMWCHTIEVAGGKLIFLVGKDKDYLDKMLEMRYNTQTVSPLCGFCNENTDVKGGRWKCGDCCKFYYCNIECQRRHWVEGDSDFGLGHKLICCKKN